MNKRFTWILVLSLFISSCSSPSNAKTGENGSAQHTQAVSATATVVETQAASNNQNSAQTETANPAATATGTDAVTNSTNMLDIKDVIEYEMKGSFNFFWEQANTDVKSSGFGLVRDRYPGSPGLASTGSLGFGLTAIVIGVDKGFISRQEGFERATKTLDTLLGMERVEGFFYHFVELQSGKKSPNSEISSIDTSLLLMGVLSVGEYFGGEVAVKAKQIYNAVNWPWFVDESKHMFYMSYTPEKGFAGHWDFYAEQLMLYVLAAGSDTHPVDDTTYYGFTRHLASYGGGKPFIHSWFGSIFTYQFSHSWIDFRGYSDKNKVNWFDNSLEASLAQVNFATDMAKKYKTLAPNAWGLTACDGPAGYNGTYGAPPSGFENKSNLVDDTVAPSGAIGSIIFLPQQAEQAMLNYYSIEKLKGKYGFYDAYNLSKGWFDADVIGIDKGIILLMLENYQNDLVHKNLMKNVNILQGLKLLQITKKQ